MRNGRITEGEVEKKINGVGQDNIDKTSQEYIAKRDQIVEYLKKGFKNFVIQRELDITPYDFDIFLRDIKYKKIMTSEEIREAREKKRQEDLKFIAESVEAELTIAQMRDLRPEFSYNEITPMIQELINLGVVTREQVDKNARNAMKKAMNKETKLSPDEQVQFILNKIKKGYSPIEIVESDKTKSLTMHKVLYQKRRLIAKGIISAEEAERAMKKRQEKALKGKHKKIIQKIKEYTELGYKVNEMSEFITEYTYNHLLKIRNDYIKENGWYTNEELKSFSEQRKKREAEEELRKFESLPPEEKKRIEEERRKEAEKAEEEKRKRQEEILAKREEKKKETLRRHLEDANILKEHLKNGNTMKQSAALMGCKDAYLYKIKKESIENGTWFTEEELKEIEKRKSQEKNGKKKEKEQEIKRKRQEEILAKRERRKEERLRRHLEDVNILKEHLKNDNTIRQAAALMGCKAEYLYRIKKESIENNTWFTEEELKEIEERRRQEQNRKKREQEEKERKRQEEILAKRERRKEETLRRHLEDANILKEHLKNGDTIKQVATLMNSSTEYLHKIKKESIENGTWLTEEELKEIEKRKLQEQNKKKEEQEQDKKRRQEEILAKRERRKEETLRKRLEDANILKEHLKNGNTMKQAMALMGCKIAYLYTIKKKSIENGTWFTEEELKEIEERKGQGRNRKKGKQEEEKRKRQEEILAKRERRKEETLRRHLEDANILKEHLKNGNTIKQAATLMNSSTEYLHKIKKESIENGTWFTEEELKEIEKRKLQEKNRKKKKQERNKKRKKAEERKKRTLKEQQRVQQEIRKLRECIENGDTYAEASKNMSYSVAYLQHLKKLAIANNLWFTDDEIKEFKRKRKIREEEERKRAEEKEQARLDKERKERERLEKEEEERIRAFDKERKRKIRGFSKEYKEYRREAKKEDKDELNGEENISAEGRKKFIEVLIKLHNLDADIPEKDIEIVLNVIHIHPEIVRKDIIKFLILDANKRGGAKSAEKMISELTDILMYTPYYSTLIEYRKWLKAQRLFPKIKAMKEKGMSNTDIGNKLGITSVEVINIFYGHEKKEALGDAEK